MVEALPVRNLEDFIRLAKHRPGQLNYATSGAGGAGHHSVDEVALETVAVGICNGVVLIRRDQLPAYLAGVRAMACLALAVAVIEFAVFIWLA